MGVRTIGSYDFACMYCSVTDWAFGPVFSDDKEHDAFERIEMFLKWLPEDARKYSDSELESKYVEWRMQESAQWAKQEEDDKLRYNYTEE